MTGIDTNILVRAITQDDPKQSAIATRVLRSCTPDDPGFIGTISLCELAWVLRRTYGIPEEQVLHALEVLLLAANLRCEEEERVRHALEGARRGGAGFADRLLAESHAAAGVTETLTFDKAASKLDGWRRLR